jgi:hypothetical protein
MKKKTTRQLKKDLKISPDINKEYSRQASLFFHYAELLETAQDILRKLNIKYSVFKATQDKKIRDRADDVGDKITETAIVAKMRRLPKWRKLKKEIAEAEYNVGMLMAARQAMSQKKAMLISLGANYREFGEISINKK